jgi:hypothetical protein
LGALPIIRFFRLGEGAVRRGADGLAVGTTPLLRRAASGGWDRQRCDATEC